MLNDELTNLLIQETQKLQEENEQLKAQIEELTKQ
jgi:hypothetical protein